MHAHADHAHALPGGADRGAQRRRIGGTLTLAAGYMVAEIVGGLWTGSLALLADAGHMAADVAALSLALFALWMASRPADSRRTFGHSRAEILAALAQGAGLLVVAALVVGEAVERFGSPREIAAPGMIAIATGGLAVNLVGLWILESGRHHNINVRGAWLHVLSDALGSVGAIVAGVLIWAWGWTWADPAASVAICALIAVSAWNLIRDAVDVLMEAAPRDLDVEEIRGALAAVPGVASVHDLHVWTIGSGEVSLSSHVVSDPGAAIGGLLPELRAILASRFAIEHATLQIEPEGSGDADCHGACAPPASADPAS